METVPPDLAAQVREMTDAQGWLPQWPRWWGDEVLAELIPDPAVRQRSAAAEARERDWPVLKQISHHLALLTEPSRVAGSLRELIGQLRRQAGKPVRRTGEPRDRSS